jgi:hypothetical protein
LAVSAGWRDFYGPGRPFFGRNFTAGAMGQIVRGAL